MGLQWLHVTCFVLLLQLSFEATSTQSGSGKRSIGFFRKPARRRTPGFFGLITQFVRETIQDTNFVVRNITDTLNSEFPPANSPNITGPSGAKRLSITDATNILGRNFMSLRRLFDREFRNAITDSRANIQNYKKEFKDAVRPYFTEGAWSSTTTQKST